MSITLNDDALTKENIPYPVALLLLLIKTKTNLSALYNQLRTMGIIKQDLFSVSVDPKWDAALQRALLNGNKSLPNIEGFDEFVKELQEIFPEGKKEGSTLYWRGNSKEIKIRLQKFFKAYNVSKEKVLGAARNYVASFNGNYTYMRVLKYFIWKDDESTSDLASYIENYSSESSDSTNWSSTLI